MVRGAMSLFMLHLTLAVGLVGLLLSAISVMGRESYIPNIPNGNNVYRNGVHWRGVGHNSASGGDPRNVFGAAFGSASNTFTNDLCMTDSDGDGYSNGRELGDPDCTWTTGTTPSSTTGISHPGFADSIPSHAFIPHCWFPVLGAFVALMLFNAW